MLDQHVGPKMLDQQTATENPLLARCLTTVERIASDIAIQQRTVIPRQVPAHRTSSLFFTGCPCFLPQAQATQIQENIAMYDFEVFIELVIKPTILGWIE